MSYQDETADLVGQLEKVLETREISFAVAESCTGGMVCSALVANPAVSGALERGFIVYSIDAKCELLDLDRGKVEECAGVSEEVARSMAEAALDNSHADIALAITGFAGPQQDDEEVGLVHFAIAARSGSSRHRQCHFGALGREQVCQRAVRVGLQMLIDAASHHGGD